MTTEVISQALSAGVQATFGQGRVWYIKQATAALTIIAEKKGSGANIRKFINVGAGFKFTSPPGEGWDYLRVTSASSQNLEIVIGDDDIEVANAVSITGTASVALQPSSTFLVTVSTTTLATANNADIAANPLRKRITIQADSVNTGSLWVRDQTGVTSSGIELQAGMAAIVESTAALRIRNNSGATQTYSVTEET